MEETSRPKLNQYIHKFSQTSPIKLISSVLVSAVILGLGTGYLLATSSSKGLNTGMPLVNQTPKSAHEDTKTFKDSAEGKITPKPEPKTGQSATPGTHLLVRDGQTPVTLTSSVVDLASYENKMVKVLGETQSVPGVPWFMDVGRVQEK